MAESSPQLTPDFVMVRTLEGIQDLREQIWPGEPKKNARPPFVFYLQTDDNEDAALDQLTGLQHAGYQLHVVAGDYYSLAIIGGKIKAAIKNLVGYSWVRSDGAVCGEAIVNISENGTDSDRILFEDVTIQQVSPDLFDNDVCLFRRVYQLDIDYQTEGSDSA